MSSNIASPRTMALVVKIASLVWRPSCPRNDNGIGATLLPSEANGESGTPRENSRSPDDRFGGCVLVDSIPQGGEGLFERAKACLEVLEAADSHVADPEDVPLQLGLPSRDDRPMSLTQFLPELRIVDPGRVADRGHRVGRVPPFGIQLQAERVDRGAGRLRKTRRARDAGFQSFRLQEAQRLPEREEQRDRGRERGVLYRERVDMGFEVRVERRVAMQGLERTLREGHGTE